MNYELKDFLDKKVEEYNQPAFIKDDPVCIPHQFKVKQDIEISGLFAAIFAWGNRATTINKARELMLLMDNAPHQFCLMHNSSDLRRLLKFKHRTFNTTDLLYFIAFLKYHYKTNTSLESAFFNRRALNENSSDLRADIWRNLEGAVETGLNFFYSYFFLCGMYL